jgi:hypothetical protein
MNFEIYSDESCLEALVKKNEHDYIAIGGIWIPANYRLEMKLKINEVKDKHSIKGEFKWNKVSPAFIDFYKDIIDYFFSTVNIRFRVILIESSKVENYKFNDNDNELSFYKFYYQLLHHWILDFNTYSIYLDHKINRDKGRLSKLQKVLDNSNLTSDISLVQGLPSEQSAGIQLADLLTGIVSAKFNKKTKSQAKLDLISLVESYLDKSISPTPKSDEKFNVFKINLQGGW